MAQDLGTSISNAPAPWATVGDSLLVEPHARTLYDDATVRGWDEYHEIRPGFALVAGSAEYFVHQRATFNGGDAFKLHFKIEGHSIISDERGHEAQATSGTMSYLVQPRNSVKFEQHLTQSRESAITFVCSQPFLAELAEDAELHMPRPIRNFIDGRDLDFHCDVMPLPAALHTMLGDILRPPYGGAMRTMMVQAKAMEVLCAALTRIAEHGDDSMTIRPRDLAKVRELCEILQADPFSNTSITRLSRMVAWNESQMTEQFRRVTGTTVFGYRQKLRMDHALRLLQASDQSITQIAFDAGYEHASNFATAFKRTFGFSPREARLCRKGDCTGVSALGKS
jgi:AraC-like DNA-binding protein